MTAAPTRLSYSVPEYAALSGKSVAQVYRMIRRGDLGPPSELPRVGTGPRARYELPAWRVHARLGIPAENDQAAS